MAQQIFGGVGFTLEYEIQLYFRRAKQQQITWNDTRTCEDLIAAAVWTSPPRRRQAQRRFQSDTFVMCLLS